MLIQDNKEMPENGGKSDHVEYRSHDNSMGLETKNQEVLDRVDESGKSKAGDDNGHLNSKSGVRDETDLVEMVAVSTPVEQIALSADVDRDKDDDVVRDCESPNRCSNSDGDNEAGNTIAAVQSNGNPENGSCFTDLSTSTKSQGPSQSQSATQSQHVDGSDKGVSLSPKPVQDTEALVSQISEVAQDSEPDTQKQFSGFDLNLEVCSETVPEDPGTNSNSNQRLDFLDFDLNVAEDTQEGKMVTSYGLPSGEESSVANPRKPERVQWDLNSMGDDQNRPRSPYHVSSCSSSSSKQPMLRNIDLNLTDQSNGEHSFISIFGARFPVKRKDNVNVDSSKHNGHHGMYGSPSHPMPYMVDPRGSPFAPQVMGSHPPFPFLMNMAATGAPAATTGLGPPTGQANFGLTLNTGSMINNGGLRQFFPQNVNEQASLSSVLGKRREPDSGWQFFSVNKQQQPRWK